MSSAVQRSRERDYTLLDHLSMLDIDAPTSNIRLTGIICTIGPASRGVNVIVDMINSGMNIARLNFSHGLHSYHHKTILNIREAVRIVSEQQGIAEYPVSIALDTKGPEIRTGELSEAFATEVEIKKDSRVKIVTSYNYKKECSADLIYVSARGLNKLLVPGNKICIDDGRISLVVEKVGSHEIICRVQNGGMLGSNKGVNFPDIIVNLPLLSQNDSEDIKYGMIQRVDMIFASYIRNAAGVKEIRNILAKVCKHVKVIAKIENRAGVKNIDEIIEESDGIMIVRGTLGIEIPPEKVFLVEKMIIAKCNIRGKPVICSTQMLESMVKKPRPTRAEVSDVANTVLEGVDCVMLSRETSIGDYPISAIKMMDAICIEAEAAIFQRRVFTELKMKTPVPTDPAESVAIAAVNASMKCCASAIIVLTTTGRSAHQISKYKPKCPIIAVSRSEVTTRQAHLWRGILPVFCRGIQVLDWPEDVDLRVYLGIEIGKLRKFINSGDDVIVVSGWRKGAGSTNTIRVWNVK